VKPAACLLIAAGRVFLAGCRSARVIRSDEVVSPVRAGESFIAPMDGWFLSDALYLRYRKAVADRIQELQGR
jgi:hypothetical protein